MDKELKAQKKAQKKAYKKALRKARRPWKFLSLLSAPLAIIFAILLVVTTMFDNTIALFVGGTFWGLENEDASAVYYEGDFATEEETALFVDKKLEDKQNNLIRKRIRLSRKCRLQEFNYFVTFTYDDKLHTEQSFKKSIMRCLRHLCERKGWRYLGVWERGGKNERLHYHALLYVPENTMPGTMFETNDFNFKRHTRKTVTQNTYFVANFGRCEFDEIHNTWEQADCLRYLMKYLEKSGERITSSKGVKEFFVSDILEEDILMQYGFDEYKVILSDDFQCIMDGELLGRVSPELIRYLIEAENTQNKKGS